MNKAADRSAQRGTILLVVVFIATAIAGLAALSMGRVVHATQFHRTVENETRAFNSAYAQIHMAMNVVNNSAYNEYNHNLVLRRAVDSIGQVREIPENEQLQKPGGEKSGYDKEQSKGQKEEEERTWLDDPEGVAHGHVEGTNVRVYRARDYVRRLASLKGDPVDEVDPGGLSDSYFVLEAAGRVGGTVRLVSALVRENQPFSSFVFFQNRGTLGVSGAPRGLIHSNRQLAFYFPDGNYVDAVSAVEGFRYEGGATQANTALRDANPSATPITLEAVDFDKLKGKSDLFVGQPDLDAEIRLYRNGKVRIYEYTPPRIEQEIKTKVTKKYVGFHYEYVPATKKVKNGTKTVEYQEEVIDHYDTEYYWKWEDVKVGTKNVTKYKDVKVQTGTKTVTKSKKEPVYEEQTVTKYKKVKVWVPYNNGDAGGGTTVGGAGGELGEYQWVDEPYQTKEMVQVGTKTVTWEEEVPVYKTVQEPYTVKENVYERKKVQKEKQVPVYKTVTKTKEVQLYKTVEYDKKVKVKEYEDIVETWTEEVFYKPTRIATTNVYANKGSGGTIYIDGRINKLYGELNGRLTIVGNDKVRISGSVKYVDSKGRPAMVNGNDYNKEYKRNSEYTGDSVLGVIAKKDIVYASSVPKQAEVNGTLMTVEGRVGIDGFWADEDGELVKDSTKAREKYLTEEERLVERAYDKYGAWKIRRYKKDSLRRIGGAISNNRIMSTYIKALKDGTSKVDAGFKRGNMRYDINLLFNPPPNFVEVPRPVLTHFVPIFFVRNHDA